MNAVFGKNCFFELAYLCPRKKNDRQRERNPILSILRGFLIHGMIVQSVQKGNRYGPVSVGAPNEKVRDDCVQYGKMIVALVKRFG